MPLPTLSTTPPQDLHFFTFFSPPFPFHFSGFVFFPPLSDLSAKFPPSSYLTFKIFFHPLFFILFCERGFPFLFFYRFPHLYLLISIFLFFIYLTLIFIFFISIFYWSFRFSISFVFFSSISIS